MAKQLQYRRAVILALLLGVVFFGLGYRLVDLQVLRFEELSAKARKNTRREFLLQPRRGDILDVKGNLLATSVFVKTVCANPALIGNRQVEVARVLAPLLQTNENWLVQRLTPQLRRNDQGEVVPNRYVVLKRKVQFETWQKIQAAMTNLSFGFNEKKLRPAERASLHDLRHDAIFADKPDDQLRTYPNQALAAHVLGYVGPDGSGTAGIERSFDSQLAGVRGWRLTETDSPGREVVPLREQDVEPRDGQNVVLTIDSVVQHIVESALAEGMEKHSPISISGIVLQPRTGEILALASLPSFDPNKPGGFTDDERRNRVITDVVEPGSTFKIVVVSGALNDGLVRLTDMFDCEHGHFHFAGHPLRDHESYGELSVEEIIMHSSNIGAAKIGIKMGQDRLYDYIRNYGFGTRTDLPLQGESCGIVHPLNKWRKVSIGQIPMGQGIAVTGLQMTMAMCAIANRGVLMRPMIVDRLERSDHTVVAKYPPRRVRQVISEAAARQMVTALKTVVSSKGTAPKAALAHYTVAGKTGTAQKAGPHGYLPDKYFASFVGFFPADDPEVCIAVMMDEPKREHGYYGGQIAAPVFKQIAESVANYLNIHPDDGEVPTAPGTIEAPLDSHSLKTAAARSH